MNQNPSPTVNAGQNLLTYAIVLVPLMSAWAIFLYLGLGSLLPGESSPPPPPDPGPSDNTKLTQDDREVEPAPIKPKSPNEYAAKERGFVLGLQLRQLKTTLDEIELKNTSVEKQIEDFEEMVNLLGSNEDGRRLASAELASKFQFLSCLPKRVERSNVKEWLIVTRARIERISEPLPNYGQILSEISAEKIALEATEKQYRVAKQGIEQLLSSSTRRYPQTLESAVESLDRNREELISQQVNVKRAAESQRLDGVIQLEKEKITRLEGELVIAKRELSSVSANSAKAIKNAQTSSASVVDKLANQKRQKVAEMKAAYPAVEQLLLPFTSKGYSQPERSRRRMQRTSERQAISYSSLLSAGTLEDSKTARKKLFHLVQPTATFGPPNDRTLGEFPAYRNHYDFDNATNQAKIQRAQSFLRKYGEAMVSEGLLSQ